MKKKSSRYLEIITDIYLCVLLLVYPLWVGPGGYMTITEAKYGFFTWSALIYLAAMVLIFAEFLMIGNARDIIGRFRHISLVKICIIIYVLFCCGSAALSKYGAKVWIGAGRYEGLGTILLYAAIFFFVSFFGRLKKWHLYLIGNVVLINTVIGVLQYVGFNPFSLFPSGYTYHDAFTLYANAFLGTLGNIDLLSAYLSLMVPLFYAFYILHEKSNLFLITYAAGVVLLLISGVSAGLVGIAIGIFITIPVVSNSKQGLKKSLIAGSLTALCTAVAKCLNVTYVNRITAVSFKFGAVSLVMALIAAVLVILVNQINNLDESSRWDNIKVKRIMTISVVSLLVAVPAIFWAYPFSNGSLSSVHKLLHGDIDTKLGSSRIQIWQQVVKLVPEHLWFGGGPDTLAERISFSFQRFNEATGTNIQSYIDTAHNDYLNILVNTGIFSLIFYLIALVSAAVRILKNAINSKTSLVIFIALLCYQIQIFFSFSICIVSPFFWVTFGLLEASLMDNSSKDVNKKVWAKN